MTDRSSPASFEQLTSLSADAPTLIEGLPGHGLVASIAVDQITEQLGLTHCGNIAADEFPPVVTFEDGLVQDLVRVYAGSDPDVMTLESDLALPHPSFEPLSRCVLDELADEFKRAIFLAGAPAESEEAIGDVAGVGTTEAVRADLLEAEITVPDDPGLVGGVTGSLVRECYRADVPAALLIVRAHPFLPDPQAAKAVIETALEPLVEFDIDTTALDEQADEIQRRMQQVAEQYQQMAQERGDEAQQKPTGMFQ
ncbi:proteasome assembly chaperone family protein [Natrarchaeobius oligotrophus]|uniref:Proteasome assembly chaperone family protein n=1 Tax=Natrarchaeobius chitinivorans TaxID=1679083 RepID=A0A3N6PEC9_NATCH|nr:PAC2 family protein [Natrarchaeobius chitinivorans]RQG95655.1 proteasome assembly chaperone family protein [Natrarchaeobius chitinivorans]